jgi:hypothetical protein
MGSSPSLGKFFLSCLITFSTCTQGKSSEDGQVEGKTGCTYMYVCMSVCATCTPRKSSSSTDLIFPSFKTGNDLLKSHWKLPLEWDLSLKHNNWSLYNPGWQWWWVQNSGHVPLSSIHLTLCLYLGSPVLRDSPINSTCSVPRSAKTLEPYTK